MPLAASCLRSLATTLIVAGLVALVGCPSAAPVDEADTPSAAHPPPVVRLLVVDDPALATAVEREWKAAGRGDFELAQTTSGELAQAERLPADVIIYPAAMLGDLAERGLIA